MEHLQRNRDVYDSLAEQFREKMPVRLPADAAIVERFSSYLPRGAAVLDIGPGSGQIAGLLCGKGFAVTCIEFSERMARVAATAAPGAVMIVDEFLAHDFGDARFDGILAMAFIHLFPAAQVPAVLAKIRSLLLPGGVVYVSTTKSDASSEGWEAKNNFRQSAPRFRKRFTREELLAMLAASGLELVAYAEVPDSEEPGKTWMDVIARVPGG